MEGEGRVGAEVKEDKSGGGGAGVGSQPWIRIPPRRCPPTRTSHLLVVSPPPRPSAWEPPPTPPLPKGQAVTPAAQGQLSFIARLRKLRPTKVGWLARAGHNSGMSGT